MGVPGARPAVPACMIELPLAVSEQTKHPDGAHAFLDSLWDIEYTGLHPGEMRRIPLMRPVLEEHIQYLKGICSRSFTDENGREYTAIVNMEGLLPYTDENIADFMKMADSACIAFPYLDFSSITRDPVMGIIQEEAAAFFSDTRTAEQAAKIIQARCAVYLQEQK